MTLSRLLTLWLCLVCTTFVRAQSGYWIQPPIAGPPSQYANNPTYVVNDVLELRWVTDKDSYQIWLWQETKQTGGGWVGSTSIFSKQPGDPQRNALNWTVTTLDLLIDRSSVFFLFIGNQTSAQYGTAITCHYFNLTMRSTSTSSVSITSVSSISSIATSSASATSQTSNSLPISPQPSSPSQTSSSGDNILSNKLELGLGLGLGIPILIVLVVIAILLFRRHRRISLPRHTEPEEYYKPELYGVSSSPSSHPPPHEMRGVTAFQHGRSWNNTQFQHHQTVPAELAGRIGETQPPQEMRASVSVTS